MAGWVFFKTKRSGFFSKCKGLNKQQLYIKRTLRRELKRQHCALVSVVRERERIGRTWTVFIEAHRSRAICWFKR